jgi:YhcH/YjgK/YiaL family protein
MEAIMIYSSIYSKFNIKNYPKVINDAIEFFKKTDFSKIAEGEYDIDGRNIFYQVKDIMTKPVNEAKPEIHRKYIDVQFLYKGTERIGVVDDNGNNEISEDYLEERDLLFYKNVENETLINMTEGDFCVFFPSDVHRPACEKNGQSMIRKVVYKINVDLLN